ncbi:hypothetical protein NA57DRAFT_55748 [Rhizodiscina lignyota]|uniref:U6 snRNA phosphodiesterase 1 n=1 Tax=Rhizodiscina lignyota TaxID=1504668 RepID=A0A9P4M9X2_9PEZI|nr:hypothetical protein NA57DRAFT_55748 [Rhizodiscina lignyota]
MDSTRRNRTLGRLPLFDPASALSQSSASSTTFSWRTLFDLQSAPFRVFLTTSPTNPRWPVRQLLLRPGIRAGSRSSELPEPLLHIPPRALEISLECMPLVDYPSSESENDQDDRQVQVASIASQPQPEAQQKRKLSDSDKKGGPRKKVGVRFKIPSVAQADSSASTPVTDTGILAPATTATSSDATTLSTSLVTYANPNNEDEQWTRPPSPKPIRNVPHREGFFATHLSIVWDPKREEHLALMNVLKQLQIAASEMRDSKGEKINLTLYYNLLESGLGAPQTLHISLSQTLYLRKHELERCQKGFETAIKEIGVRPFEVSLGGLEWVWNHQHNRCFLVLGVNRPVRDGLNHLLSACNKVCRAIDQPELYARAGSDEDMVQGCPGGFHISIGWNLEGPPKEFQLLMEAPRIKKVLEDLKSITFKVDTLGTGIG